jgi:Tfp pilus assembly major pilin PilA
MTPVLMDQAFDLLAMADLIAGVLTGVKIHLYQNNTTYNPNVTTLLDLTEATYTGYAPVTLTWDAASVSDDGNVETHSNRVTWRPTDGVTPNDIYGYYITDTAGTALLGGGRFDGAPLPMHGALDVILTTVVFRFGNQGYVSLVS